MISIRLIITVYVSFNVAFADESFDICTQDGVLTAAVYNPFVPFQVLLFADDFFWEYDVKLKTVSERKMTKSLWKELELPISAADALWIPPKKSNYPHWMQVEFVFIRGMESFYYHCNGTLNDCQLVTGQKQFVNNAFGREPPLNMFGYQEQMPKPGGYMFHIYSNTEMDCEVRREDSSLLWICATEDSIAAENFNKVWSSVKRDEKVVGISAFHWRTPNITDYVVATTTHLRYTLLGGRRVHQLNLLFGCFSWLIILKYGFFALTLIAIVSVITATILVYKREVTKMAFYHDTSTATTVGGKSQLSTVTKRLFREGQKQ